jgi:hypothetical protein
LPDTPKKADAAETLQRAEMEFKIAKAETARKLGHELCHAHFPPEIMLSSDNKNWKCPTCGNQIGTRPSFGIA